MTWLELMGWQVGKPGDARKYLPVGLDCCPPWQQTLPVHPTCRRLQD